MLSKIYWRTWAELLSPYLVGAFAAAQVADYNVTVEQAVVGVVVATLGAFVAVLVAVKWGVAPTRLQKSLRSAGEKLVIGLPTIVVVRWADILSLPRIAWPVIVGTVGAFALTWLMNPPVDVLPPPVPAPA